MLIYENIQELDTFESFYSTPFMGNGNLIIPFINIGVSLHPINPNKSPLYLDKSYLVFFDADIIAENGRYTRYCDPPKQTVTIGGISVSKLQHVELKLCFSSAFLQILPDTKKSEHFWIPIATPNLPINMRTIEVDEFFKPEALPPNLASVLNIAN